jgi:hypothetical protein
MINWIRDKLIAKLLEDSFKQIEKANWMTSVLKICYKQKVLKSVWSNFITSAVGLLEDAIDEAKQARSWS